ncbi:hypothetical protein chiPu_0032772, partial [Chiloscyllium punctatum]|nr:hypothetical protein [Chiloscyllium punctatum]
MGTLPSGKRYAQAEPALYPLVVPQISAVCAQCGLVVPMAAGPERRGPADPQAGETRRQSNAGAPPAGRGELHLLADH